MSALAVAQPVELRAADGVLLRGLSWPGDSHAALLVHDIGADLDALSPLADAMATTGFTVLSLDLRGHGASDGEPDAGNLADDVQAGLGHLRSHGSLRLFVIGDGAAATACVGFRRQPGVAAVVLLSPESSSLDVELLAPAGEAAMLIVVGGHDLQAVRVAEALRDRLTGFCAVARLPTIAQGAALLRGPLASQAVDLVRVFLARYRT